MIKYTIIHTPKQQKNERFIGRLIVFLMALGIMIWLLTSWEEIGEFLLGFGLIGGGFILILNDRGVFGK